MERRELKSKYVGLIETQKGITSSLIAGIITTSEAVGALDRVSARLRGWRRSCLQYLATCSAMSYNEVKCIYSKYDNTDLFHTFIK